jgi:hypothetical protein
MGRFPVVARVGSGLQVTGPAARFDDWVALRAILLRRLLAA